MKTDTSRDPATGDLGVSDAVEPERYELRAQPAYRFEPDMRVARRGFFRVLGGGIGVVALAEAASAQESGGGRGRGAPAVPTELSAWLHIGKDGVVTVSTGKVEVGQGIRTSLAQAVAEELRAPLGNVRLIMGDTALVPFDMGTFGSRTTPAMAPQLRRAAATARELLLDLAAQAWKVDRGSLSIADGKVMHETSRRTTGFGDLAAGQKLLRAVGDGVVLTPAETWQVAGKPAPRTNARALVTGEHRYASDVTRPGLWHGRVVRPPVFGARLVDVKVKAEGALGAARLVRDGDFVGVAAADAGALAGAAAALDIDWQKPAEAAVASAGLFAHLRARAKGDGGGGRGPEDRGDIAAGLAAGKHRITATFTAAYIAHAPLEPRAAVAEWQGDRLTVWTGTQRPFGVRRELAEALRVPEDRVRVIVPDTGSGYGGKHSGEAAVEAARLAREVRRPVKLVWTREEEFTWAYFRPAALIDVRAAVDAAGKLTAWEMVTFNAGASGLRTPYEVANARHVFRTTDSPLRQGSYRALAATANHFAREVAMDELAAAATLDPLTFRERNLGDARLRAVMAAAAEKFGWGKRKPGADTGFGLAVGTDKGGYLATCVEVGWDSAATVATVRRVVTAFECGAIVNPGLLRSQVEGAAIQGLGGALHEAIEFGDGRVSNARFSKYRVPRFSDLPVMETVLLDRKDLPSAGAGEAPIVAIAPAISNALFAIDGRRHREMPMRVRA